MNLTRIIVCQLYRYGWPISCWKLLSEHQNVPFIFQSLIQLPKPKRQSVISPFSFLWQDQKKNKPDPEPFLLKLYVPKEPAVDAVLAWTWLRHISPDLRSSRYTSIPVLCFHHYAGLLVHKPTDTKWSNQSVDSQERGPLPRLFSRVMERLRSRG